MKLSEVKKKLQQNELYKAAEKEKNTVYCFGLIEGISIGFDSAMSLKCEDCKYYVGDWHDCEKDVMLGCDPTFFCKHWEGK